MKNKSKLNRIKSGGQKVIRNWFYMSDGNISIENIKTVWEEYYGVEIWKEQQILEITLDNAGIDLESCPTDFWDEESLNYLDNNNVNTVYAITVTETGTEEINKAMKILINALGGWFAADTDNFEPRID